MKKTIIVCILIAICNTFALNKIVIPQRAAAGNVITASKTNENLDTIASKFNKLIDSVDVIFPRFTDYSSGDSTLVAKRSGFDTTNTDTLNVSEGAYITRLSTPSAGITRANMDSLYSIAARFLRIYSPQADIDSLVGDVKTGGNLSVPGNVGIKKITPTKSLDVVGSSTVSDTSFASRFSGPLTGDVTGNVTGSVDSVRSSAWYLDTTFYDSLYDNTTYRSRALCRIIKIGKSVTLFQNLMVGTLSGGAAWIKGIPSKFHCAAPWVSTQVVQQNGAYITGTIYYNHIDNSYSIANATLGALSAGTGGFFIPIVIQWILN